VKNQTHFFSSYEGRRSRNHNIVVSPAALGAAVPDNEDEHLAFFRVDHQHGQRQLVTARYNGQFFQWHREIGGLGLPGTGTAYTNNVHTVLLTDAFTVSSRLLNESRLQFARYVDTRFDLQPTVYIYRAGYSTEGGALGRFGLKRPGVERTPPRRADTLKLGGDEDVRSQRLLNFGRAYSCPRRSSLCAIPFAGLASTDEAATADPRSPRHLASSGRLDDRGADVEPGLRYDIERVYHLRNYPVPVDTNTFSRALARRGSCRRRADDCSGGAGLYTQQQLLYYINRVQLEGPDGR
jgi:hypothetical protein